MEIYIVSLVTEFFTSFDLPSFGFRTIVDITMIAARSEFVENAHIFYYFHCIRKNEAIFVPINSVVSYACPFSGSSSWCLDVLTDFSSFPLSQ